MTFEPSANDKLTTDFRISICPLKLLYTMMHFRRDMFFLTGYNRVQTHSREHVNTTAAHGEKLPTRTTATSCRVDDLITLSSCIN